MKTTIKQENDEILVLSLKHVSGLTVVVNRTGTPKLWHIGHETNGHQTGKGRVFGQITQTYIESYGQCKFPGAPKLWAIAHENNGKTRKQIVFGHNSQTCIGSYGRRKSPWNVKTVDNSS
jgi:hypothetical protein